MDYEKEVAALAELYKIAVSRIRAELERLDVTNMSRANSRAALAEVARILKSLNAESKTWVADNIPEAAHDGIEETLVRLGEVETLAAAKKVASFNRINERVVAAAVADTMDDLLAVTQNIDRRVRATIQRVAGESLRENLAAGINGQKTIKREMVTKLRKELSNAVDTGIVDAAGRRWKPEVYAEMLSRTKLHAVNREARINEAVSHGAFYGRISSHGATDACSRYEGMVVKLIRDAPGEYPYIGDLPRREIFHPNCRHTISPLKYPEDLTENKRKIDETKREIYNVRNDIQEGRINKSINKELQDRHIEGTYGYKEYVKQMIKRGKPNELPSILTADADFLIEKYAGKSDISIKSGGRIFEKFIHSEVIGYVMGVPTKTGSIRYRKQTGTHIVPIILEEEGERNDL